MSPTTPRSASKPSVPDDARVHAALNRAVSELEAAVHETEQAAERILGISELLMGHVDGPSQQRLVAIMEACSFQDLTGQRIRKVARLIKYLRDQRLVDAADLPPARAPKPEQKKPEGLTQEEVDRLLNGG